jgi:hypothetical protein
MTIAKQLQEVREALGFYADDFNYPFNYPVADISAHAVLCEGGRKAQSALTALDAVIAGMGWQPDDNTSEFETFMDALDINDIGMEWVSARGEIRRLWHERAMRKKAALPTPPTGEPKSTQTKGE